MLLTEPFVLYSGCLHGGSIKRTCFVLCAIRKSNRALFAFCTSSSIWLAVRDLKSEAFVAFFFSGASASATTGVTRRTCNLSSGRGLADKNDAALDLKEVCELAKENDVAPAIAEFFCAKCVPDI